jgi:hypothetical protein
MGIKNPCEAFAKPGKDEEFSFHYLDMLRENLGQAEQGVSRQLILITTLSAIFLLLAENQVHGISLSFIELTKYSYVEAIIPAIIAALYLSMVNSMQMAIELSRAFVALIKYLRPKIYDNDYERLLWPPTGVFTAVAALPTLLESRLTRSMGIGVGRCRYLIYILAPVGMVIYAIYHLLSSSPGPFQYFTAVLSGIIILLASPLSISIIYLTLDLIEFI